MTANFDGDISLWNTTDSQWRIVKSLPSNKKYAVNKLSLCDDKTHFAIACSDGLSLFELKKDCLAVDQKNPFELIKHIPDTNVISLGFFSTN